MSRILLDTSAYAAFKLGAEVLTADWHIRHVPQILVRLIGA